MSHFFIQNSLPKQYVVYNFRVKSFFSFIKAGLIFEESTHPVQHFFWGVDSSSYLFYLQNSRFFLYFLLVLVPQHQLAYSTI